MVTRFKPFELWRVPEIVLPSTEGMDVAMEEAMYHFFEWLPATQKYDYPIYEKLYSIPYENRFTYHVRRVMRKRYKQVAKTLSFPHTPQTVACLQQELRLIERLNKKLTELLYG